MPPTARSLGYVGVRVEASSAPRWRWAA